MRNRVITLLAGLAIGAATLASATGARANGVFPNAGQIVIDPTDPAHIVVRTTYGVLTTREGGEPWDWICESAVGYGSGFHPAVALTEDGTLLAGLDSGVGLANGSTCSWSKVAGALDGALVVDLSVEKSALSHVVLVTSKGASGAGQFWTSEDNGTSWVKTGSDLPAGFVPLTVDVAPSDPMRVYVTAIIGGAGTQKGSLLVSDDRGATWSQFSVPSSDGDHAPYIGGIDPSNADRVFVRNDGMPGRLFSFDRALGTFTQIFTAQGILRGFALSPDGATLLVGGSSDGIWRAPQDTLVFEKRSEVATRCLTWTAQGVYSCATEFASGFTVGLSKDEGATFEPVMHLPCVRGPLECAPDTQVGAECPSQWPAVALQIGADDCASTSAGGGGAGGSGAAGGGGAGAGATGGGGASTNSTTGEGAATSGEGAGGAGGEGAGANGPGDGGCTCSLPGAGSASTSGSASAAASTSPRKGLSHPDDRPEAPTSPGACPFLGLAASLLVFRRGRRRATPRA